MFQNFDLANLGQDHELPHSQWCRVLNGNNPTINVVSWIFVLALTISEKLTFKNR